MKLLFDWIRTGFRSATRLGILQGVDDAAGVLSGGTVSLDPALLTVEAEEPDDEPPAETASKPSKPKRKSR